MMNPTYSISELSEQFDVTPRTIRFYETQGLMDPQREGTRRIYHERDRVRLYDSASGEVGQMQYVLEVIEKRRKILNQQQEDILHTLQDIKNVEDRILQKMETIKPT